MQQQGASHGVQGGLARTASSASHGLLGTRREKEHTPPLIAVRAAPAQIGLRQKKQDRFYYAGFLLV
jgi:hypothetical protein